MARILIVEDNVNINRAYKIILEKEGHDVNVVFDGKEALKQADLVKPELILLDLQMPIMGGLEFLQQYDLAKKHPDVQVIILSNLDGHKEIQKALDLGAFKYILKARTSPRQLSLLIHHLIEEKASKT